MKFFNSLTLKKEDFKPIKAGKVSLYSCGPTVYNYAHIGNFRAYLFTDLLRRWLEHEKYSVKAVMNLTDVDDKTIKGSREEDKSLEEFTEFYSKAFFEDLDSLGIKRADVYPTATGTIPEMIELIEKLLAKGIAYEGDDGSIYYSISKFKNYGKLSHLDFKGLKAGASGRVAADEYEKESVSDFALWKAYTKDDGDVVWDAPFGRGRPGWHIECSAMSMKFLGESFDIHTGGIDLKFPHHENEVAQSEGATGKKFVKYWLHNEFLLVDGKKMSKRFHNFYTLRDILAKGYSPRAIRMLLLSTHYRSQLNFTFEALDNANNTITKIGDFVLRLQNASGTEDSRGKSALEEVHQKFSEALNDDLDVATALSAFFSFEREFNKLIAEGKVSKTLAKSALEFVKEFDSIFGVIDWTAVSSVETNSLAGSEVMQYLRPFIIEREIARKNKAFRVADKIRDRLMREDFIVEDKPTGVSVFSRSRNIALFFAHADLLKKKG